ncbi:MAG: YggS family pyridoxal phosphate-dependent enzyme [Clostridia bacterium]|nr:YggS family pyridoxal phosphate-dependent enzyme [Clostridia bacterium]
MEDSVLIRQLNSVRTNILNTCEHMQIPKEAVCLIAVSKTKPVSMIKEVYQAGIRDFGENKVQELIDKYEQLPKDIRWHLIGHLQTNKVKYVVGKTTLIHGVDSIKLAKEISKEAQKKQIDVDILIQVNIANEETKYGFKEEEVIDRVIEISKMEGIHIKGLMIIAPYVDNSEENRLYFQKMKQLYVDIIQKNIDNVHMEVLSMGMTGDYQVAIEEGASCVRVGTAIFGMRDYANSH